ncbi:MAG: hypothetical protein ACOC5S_06040, partial [Acidobacteriota bacterium]
MVTICSQAQRLKEKLLEIKKKLVTREGIRYPQPMLIDQIQYLYSILNRADQKPGKDAYERHEELQPCWTRIRTSDPLITNQF